MLNEQLEAEIRNCLDDSDKDEKVVLLQCGSSMDTGAIIFHVYVGKGAFPALTIKTPRNPSSAHRITAEWNFLNGLSNTAGSIGFAPQRVKKFKVASAVYYVYRTFAGRSMFAWYRNRIFRSAASMTELFGKQALPIATGLHDLDSRKLSSTEVTEVLNEELESLRIAVAQLPDSVLRRCEQAAEHVSTFGALSRSGLVHGDFSPYNILTRGMNISAPVCLIDWEHSSSTGMQFMDILRFLCACCLMSRASKSYLDAFEQMSSHNNPLTRSLLIPWLESSSEACESSPTLDRELSRSLWILFWIHAARIEQLRSTNPADLEGKVYLPTLIQILDRWNISA